MKDRIIEKSMQLWPNQEGNVEDDINAYKRYIYLQGAIKGEEDVIQRLYDALKGLGLEKHSIVFNVLKIAGIELPKAKNETNG